VLCQDGALRLSALRGAFALDGCRLIAIGCSLEDAQEFVAARHLAGFVAVDELKAAHAAVGCGVESALGFLKPQVWLAVARAVRMGLAVKPTRGEYAQLGATFVCDAAAPERPWCYAHRQRHWADHPDPAHVLAAVETAARARLCSHGALVRARRGRVGGAALPRGAARAERAALLDSSCGTPARGRPRTRAGVLE
jgi:hypothetical protein